MTDVELLARAFRYACDQHATQRRKGEARDPYANHLAEVAESVALAGGDAVEVAAAILHDVVEDTAATEADVEARFGPDVAGLVMEVTDDKSLPKDERKAAQVSDTPHKSDAAKRLKLADKASNLRALRISPPDWPPERVRAYLDWARAVAEGARGVSRRLEDQFDVEAGRLEKTLGG